MNINIELPSQLVGASRVAATYICYALVVFLVYIVLELAVFFGYILARFIGWLFSRKIKITSKKGILITGATSGIGLLLVKHFYKLGFTIFVGYYNDKEPGYNELLELIDSGNNHGQRLFLIKMDVRSLESIRAASAEIDSILEAHQLELYCVLNNAGISKIGPFQWTDPNGIKDTVETNLIGTMLVTRQFLLRIIQSRGRVVNVGSGLAFLHVRELSAYSTSKCAIDHFTKALNYDLAEHGITCYCVHPGNFIANTNISFVRLKSHEQSISLLTDEETSVYARSIARAQKIALGCVRERLDKGDDNWKQTAAAHTIEIPECLLEPDKLERRKLSLFKRVLLSIMRTTEGCADDLEESGIVRAYEQVVCHKSPPMRVYAGGFIYMHVFGPVLEKSPPLISALWSKLANYSTFRYK